MTLSSLINDPDGKLNVMLAELVGWTIVPCQVQNPDGSFMQMWRAVSPKGEKAYGAHASKQAEWKSRIPRYSTDLNACHEVKRGFGKEKQDAFAIHLSHVIAGSDDGFVHKLHRGDRIDCTTQILFAEPKEVAIALILTLSRRSETTAQAEVGPASTKCGHVHIGLACELPADHACDHCAQDVFDDKLIRWPRIDAKPTSPPASDSVRRES